MATNRRDQDSGNSSDEGGRDRKRKKPVSPVPEIVSVTVEPPPAVAGAKAAQGDIWVTLLESSPWSANPTTRAEASVSVPPPRLIEHPPVSDPATRWSQPIWRTPVRTEAVAEDAAPEVVVVAAADDVVDVAPMEIEMPAVAESAAVEDGPVVDADPALVVAVPEIAVEAEPEPHAEEAPASQPEQERAVAFTSLAELVGLAQGTVYPDANPVAVEPVPEPEPVPEVEAVAAEPEPAPEVEAVAAEPEPAPEVEAVAAEPEPVPEAEAVAAEPEPVPEAEAVAAEPEPVPEAEIVAAEPALAVPEVDVHVRVDWVAPGVEPEIVADMEVLAESEAVATEPEPQAVVAETAPSVSSLAELVGKAAMAEAPAAVRKPAAVPKKAPKPQPTPSAAAVREVPVEDLVGGLFSMAGSAARGVFSLGGGLVGGVAKGGRLLGGNLVSGTRRLADTLQAGCGVCSKPKCGGESKKDR